MRSTTTYASASISNISPLNLLGSSQNKTNPPPQYFDETKKKGEVNELKQYIFF